MYNILVVEDEPQISEIVLKYLDKEGYRSYLATNGLEALAWFNNNQCHLVILDIMMPGIDGFQVLERIRETSLIPIIMLTAREDERDRLKGFELGADDYVIKPFSPRELMSRIKVFLTRVYQREPEIMISCGPFKCYTSSMRFFKEDKEIYLTATEFKLLTVFVKNAGQILTREQLIELAFSINYEGFDRNIDSYTKRIRQKIEDNPKTPKYLRTKYGQGYIFGGDDLSL